VGSYIAISQARTVNGVADQITPNVSKIGQGFTELFEPICPPRDEVCRKKNPESRLWLDAKASGMRIGVAFLIILTAVLLGTFMGTFPHVNSTFGLFVTVIAEPPVNLVLPLFAIALGLGETAKIAFLVVAVYPKLALHTANLALRAAPKLVIKGHTNGLSEPEIAMLLVFPRILPEVLETLGASLQIIVGAVIVAEPLVSAQYGIGTSLFFFSRNSRMYLVIPYALIITVVLVALELGMKRFNRKVAPWYHKEEKR
jgi:NitT/TauT family transport system permease protein